jgi:hypothetical protein
MVMRRRLGIVAGTTWLVLAAAVVTAAPAGARNVGGTVPAGATCVQPGGVVLTDQAASVVPCLCYSTEFGTFRNVGGTGPSGGDCPPGVNRIKIDRNVGG